MIRSIQILCIMALLILSSCHKWLDAKADISLAIPSNLKDYQAMMDNTGLINLSSNYLNELAADYSLLNDADYNNMIDGAKNAYAWSHDLPYIYVSSWNNYGYPSILVCNTVLYGLSKLKTNNVLEQQQCNDIKGQALFNRALTFYDLAQLWAPVYDAATASFTLSIPLKLDPDINTPILRSTVEETYQQILQDLLAAKDILPAKAVYQTRATKSACFALLARVYLSMTRFAEAKIAADSCLQFHNTLIDYNNVSNINITPFQDYRNNQEILFFRSQSYTSFTTTRGLIDSNVYNMYVLNDLRRNLFFSVQSGPTYTFRGSYIGSLTSNFSGLATDEVYLTRAECKARLGQKDAALLDLDTLLIKRWKTNTFVKSVAASADDALVLILAERKKELLRRGLRWTDQRRLNKDPRFAVTVTRVINGVTHTLEPNSYRYTFPIPDDIMQYHPDWKQNPGW